MKKVFPKPLSKTLTKKTSEAKFFIKVLRGFGGTFSKVPLKNLLKKICKRKLLKNLLKKFIKKIIKKL